MEALFTAAGQALGGTAALALLAAAGWGVLSVVLSPCHLSSIPLLVGYLQRGEAERRRGGALWLSSLFALGILVTVATLGVATAAAGNLVGDLGPWASYVAAALFFVTGLHLVGVIPFNWDSLQPRGARRGAVGAFLLGLAFGIGLGPCTFAFMAPVLAAAFGGAARAGWGMSTGLVVAFALGHCAVIAFAGASGDRVQRLLTATLLRNHTGHLRALTGVVLILGGLWMLDSAR